MSDEELRALEREVAESGRAEARLRLAALHERAGELERARDVLLAGRTDAAIRREIAKWPIWNGGYGCLGEDSFVDVPAVLRPRAAWTFPGDDEAGPTSQIFVATAHALVCRGADGHALVLDGMTGAPVAQLSIPEWRSGLSSAAIVGDVMLYASQGMLVAHDLWTGEQLYRVSLGRVILLMPGSRVALTADGAEACVFDLSEPRREPQLLWRMRNGPTDSLVAAGPVLLAAVGRSRTTRALDRANGQIVRTISDCVPVSADNIGFLGHDDGAAVATLVAVAANGDRLWASPTALEPLGLARDFYLGVDHSGAHLGIGVADRGTGQLLKLLGTVHDYGAVAMVRDALYYFHWLVELEPEFRPIPALLRAIRPDGTELWTLSPDELGGDVFGIAPVPGRIYVLGRSGQITCLVDDA